MRGKASLRLKIEPLRGITPAYAGKRAGLSGLALPDGDHPRVCGEKCRTGSARPAAPGSPPRMRGKGCLPSGRRGLQGITPAYAGKRHRLYSLISTSRDHPRVCGEKFDASVKEEIKAGSPPRMRGKGIRKQTCNPRSGITPAYAGKRFDDELDQFESKDHPRVCGEKFVRPFLLRWCVGSPPRMRGKGYGATIGEDGMRITPAYAGKSSFGLPSQTFTGDHPRVCGEKSHCVLSLYVVLGSPPRMRGKGVNPCNQRVAVRITPAYAGKSLHPPAEYILTGDHPRVCGEKGDAASYRAWRRGSPPRMRGKASLSVLSPFRSGITPAYAGKSSLLFLALHR